MKILLLSFAILLGLTGFSQTYLTDQHFSNVAPSGWSSTSSVWNFAYNGSSTANYRNVHDATTYSARFSSAATGNSIYLYIPANFVSGNTYTITFYTKRVCSVVVNTNELPNQTTLLSSEERSNSSCSSNFNTWYEWSFTILSSYTGAGYFQIWTKTIYGGPTSVYMDDVSIFEAEPTTLPIELLYFRGSEHRFENVFDWSTASEYNNERFTIEKSADGIDWVPVAIVPGAGNSSSQRFYRASDYRAEKAINYYRLKQTDYDGKFEYSDIISIDNRITESSKEAVRTINMMGQEVDPKYYRGMAIICYGDGTSELVNIVN